MSGHERRTHRPGMTMVEMVIALVVVSVIISSAIGFLQMQGQVYHTGAERMAIVQNLRYVANTLEREVRTAGSHVPAGQPAMVVAAENVVAFNADYNSSDPADPWAVYADASLDSTAVRALPQLRRYQIPNTTFTYPSTTYMDEGSRSPAETIIFYFGLDQSTLRSGDYALYRRINDRPAEIVARDLLPTPGKPWFEYFRIVTTAGGTLQTVQVPQNSLPLIHQATIHGSGDDVGSAAVIDSVRAVRVNYRTTNARFAKPDQVATRDITRLIALPNAGGKKIRTCGDDPLFGVEVNGEIQEDTINNRVWINLSWPKATDEATGEEDVVRYVIWRATDAPDWIDPYKSIPAGNEDGVDYLFTDQSIQPGTTYYYGIGAQDCTPSLSETVVVGPLTP